MPYYEYSQLDSAGSIKKEVRFFLSKEAFDSYINTQSILVIECKQASAKYSRQFPIVDFCFYMTYLLKNKVPIVTALELMANHFVKMRRTLFGIIEMLYEGTPLHQAFSQFESPLPTYIAIGENTGNMEEYFQKAYDFLTWKRKLRQEITSSLRYPFFVLISVMVLVLFSTQWLIPEIQTFVKISAVSIFFIEAVSVMIYALLSSIFCFFVVYKICAFLGMSRMLAILQYIIAHLPFIGEAYKSYYHGYIMILLASLVKENIYIDKAIPIVLGTIKNEYIKSVWQNILNAILAGENFNSVFKFLDKTDREVLEIASENNILAECFAYIGEKKINLVKNKADFVIKCIEPMLILFFGMFIMWIVFVMLVPLYNGMPHA